MPAARELGTGPADGLGEPSFPAGTSLPNSEPQRNRRDSLTGHHPQLCPPCQLALRCTGRGDVYGNTSPSPSAVRTP